MAIPTSPERQQIACALSRELGQSTALVSLERDDQRNFRGVAVCAGRVLSFVLEAQAQRLRTRPLFNLLQHSCRSSR